MTDLDIFHNAPEDPTAEQLAAYLDEQCGDDAELRAKVESLFATAARGDADDDDDFLSQSPVQTPKSDTPPTDPNAPWEPPSVERLHELLPQYEITGIAGRGGMGAVYRGRQAKLGRDVAIKVLPETFNDPAAGEDHLHFAERFELEARSMANLDHPAIVSVYDFGETEDGQLYFVMEFIDGMDIHQYLQHHGGQLEQAHALAITAHVLDALDYAHEHGIIHRDIKPSNILLNHEGRVKIADFGLAKVQPADGVDSSQPALTATNMALGTPDFVAPEALDSDQTADERADLYAVGVMLYQMLTGKLPRGHFKLPSDLRPELDPRLDEIVSKSMQADPNDRYGSASEIRWALEPVFSKPVARLEGREEDFTSPVPPPPDVSTPAEEPTAAPVRLATAPVRPASRSVSKEKTSSAAPFVVMGLAVMLAIGGFVAWKMLGGNDDAESLASVATTESVPAPDPEPSPEPEPQNGGASAVLPANGEPTSESPAASDLPPEPEPEPDAKSDPDSNPEPAPAVPLEQDPPGANPDAALAEVPGLNDWLGKYLDQRRTRVDGLATQYLRGLDARLNQAADAGDLKLATAFREEKDRVQALQQSLAKPSADPVAAAREHTTLPELGEGSPAGLATLRKTWTGEHQKIRADLDPKLEQSLQIVERDLTRKRDFDNARRVLAFRESLFAAAVAEPPGGARSSVPASPEPAPAELANATQAKPFENSLGMRFVPVPITGGPSDGKTVLFSIWETRVEDYAAFIKENNGHEWSDPEFKQADDHPAVNLTWDDAQAFCKWLTELDQRNGKLGKDEQYRLPTDHEWSCAVGIGKDEDAEEIPAAKGAMIATVYPWGVEYPPSKGAGNYNGDETRRNPVTGRKPIKGYDDGFDRTAPVGSFEVNEYGLYDMGGNVWEWCEDWYSTRKEKRVLRGSCWGNAAEHIVFSAFRAKHSPDHLSDDKGFRVVVASGGIEAAPQKPIAPAPLAGTNTAMGITSATKDKPFENSLGMRFVPVPITGGPSQGKTILFSIWETRVKDYEEFIRKDRERQVPEPVFKQRDDHPVVKATWDDAVAFCEWLTEEDREKGKLGEGERYRLPSDHEWSCAVGIGTQEVAEMTPSIKNQKNKDIYPWGKNYPPPKDSGNYYGEETKRNPAGNRKPIEGYDDGFDRTAPVGSFEVNEYGLYDMGGNVWEWCEDWYSKGKRVVRGSSWMQISESDLRSSCRNYGDATGLYNGSNTIGFRLVVAGVENGQPKPATPKPVADPVEAMRKAGEEYRNGIGMKLCWIPAGTFTMGSPADEPEREADEEAQVEVELTRGFWMAKYEVTQGEYEEIAGINPSKFKEAGKRAPVDLVSWAEAAAFCEKLTDRERNKGKLPEGWAYALPSEAQWEYACRAGEKGPYSGGDLDEVAWYRENGGGKVHEVGEKKPNAWGLYDMHGNAREWCQDWLAESLAGGKDPTGPVTGSKRMTRGGSSYNIPGLCRSAHRSAGAVERRPFVGFRVCLRPIR